MRRLALLLVLSFLGCRAQTAAPPSNGVVDGDDGGLDGGPPPWPDDDADPLAADEAGAEAGGDSASDDATVPTADGASEATSSTTDAAPDADADADAGSTPSPSAGPPFDAGEGGACADAPSTGDLVIDELMIASVAGSGDHGEWLEIASQLDCAVDVRGLRGDAPSGASVRSFVVASDLWLPARGTFVAADSANPVVNHGLPGSVVAWSGQPGDVLRNQGDTITLRLNGVVLDSITYPSLPTTPGRSLAFPSDCPPERRADWTAWQPSTASWMTGFFGTPNAPNTDVSCP